MNVIRFFADMLGSIYLKKLYFSFVIISDHILFSAAA